MDRLAMQLQYINVPYHTCAQERNSLSNPLAMGCKLVAGKSDGLDISLDELWLQLGDFAQFGGANGSEVTVVRRESQQSCHDQAKLRKMASFRFLQREKKKNTERVWTERELVTMR